MTLNVYLALFYTSRNQQGWLLDLADSSEKIHFEVSLLVSQDKKRLGIGKAALLCARQMALNSIFHAEISPDNKARRSI